jgi:molecular chaperone GrpE
MREPEEEGAAAGPEAAEPTGGDPSELEGLRREVEALNDRHLRLAAEFDNFRKRAHAQIADSGVRAQAHLVGTLLDVLDDLRRVSTLDPGTSSADSVVEGVAMVERKLVQVLEDAGLQELRPEGEPFDPNVMEALQRVPAESAEEDDTVARVLQRGFRFRGQLVRPARVSVRKLE